MLKKAKTYMEKLANGINPLDDTVLADEDVINNVRLSRCFFYVSDVLRQVIDKGGMSKKTKITKENFSITFEQAQRFEFSLTPIPVSEIAKRINATVENDNMKKLTHKHLTQWLISIDMLQLENKPDGKVIKMPTQNGTELGIFTEHRNGIYGAYTVVLYNRNAQQFIVDNIDAVVGMMY